MDTIGAGGTPGMTGTGVQSAELTTTGGRASSNAPGRTPLQIADITPEMRPGNPQSRLYLPEAERPQAEQSYREAERAGIEGLTEDQKIAVLRLLWSKGKVTDAERAMIRRITLALPPSPALRAYDGTRAQEIGRAMLADPEMRNAFLAWVSLSETQRLRLLQRVIDIHAKVFGTQRYPIETGPLPRGIHPDAKAAFDPNRRVIRIDPKNLKHTYFGDATRWILEEAHHAYQHDLEHLYLSGRLSSTDPRFRRSQIYVLLGFFYIRATGPGGKSAYEEQPVEADAKLVASIPANIFNNTMQEEWLRRGKRR